MDSLGQYGQVNNLEFQAAMYSVFFLIGLMFFSQRSDLHEIVFEKSHFIIIVVIIIVIIIIMQTK